MASGNPLFVTPAPARTPSLARTPDSAPTPTPAPSAASIDLTGDEDPVYLHIPDEGVEDVLPSQLLRFVKQRGIQILKTASKNCQDAKLKQILRDRTDNVQLSNTTARMVHGYERSWAKELSQARKFLAEEVGNYNEILEDRIERENHVARFQAQFVAPMEDLLAQADHNIRAFRYLIDFLKARAGI